MIKLIIFDMDGTLISMKEHHQTALNLALSEVDPKYVITPEEQVSTYEAIPTSKKLEILTNTKSLPPEFHEKIATSKQAHTLKLLSEFGRDNRLCEIFERLKYDGFFLAVASNSVRA